MNYGLLVLPILFLIMSTIAYFKKEHNKMMFLGILALFIAIFRDILQYRTYNKDKDLE